MKLLFINCAYPKEIELILRANTRVGWQPSANVFQWAVIDGLDRCCVDYTLLCTPALPAWPRYRSLLTPEGCMSVNGIPRGWYLRYCTAPVISQFSRKMALIHSIKQWCEQNRKSDRLVIICYTQQADLLGAAISLKSCYPNLIVATIVTDLIDNALDFAQNRKFLKRIQVKLEELEERRLFPKVDRFILLTRQMIECIPEATNRFIVMEGIAPWERIKPRESLHKKDDERTLLYSGTFQEFGGLRMLVDAFLQTQDARFRLVLCGDGVLSEYIKTTMKRDRRIIYKGLVDHDEAIRLQRECTLLVNPRRPNGDITKYSFPSKTMEYMSSLTPMIGYHLEGIPEEYYPYMYTPKDLTQDALVECINNTLSLSLDTLQNKAKKAFQFVAENKNSAAQVKKIIDFLSV